MIYFIMAVALFAGATCFAVISLYKRVLRLEEGGAATSYADVTRGAYMTTKLPTVEVAQKQGEE